MYAVTALITEPSEAGYEKIRAVTPCSDVTGYRRFEGPCHLHLQSDVTGTW
jgi:hypothetical protein